MSQIVTQVRDVSETTTHGLTCQCGETFQTTDELENHIAVHQRQPDPQERETRQPTEAELDALIEWKQEARNYSRETALNHVDQAFYVVIEDYQTGCPGYTGRVLVEIGGAGPSAHAVYTWHDNGLKRHPHATYRGEGRQ